MTVASGGAGVRGRGTTGATAVADDKGMPFLGDRDVVHPWGEDVTHPLGGARPTPGGDLAHREWAEKRP
ncbi:hypothetical protein GCM10011579_018820 [Streptomyces albiflavescens]|uniref:Uncharacterized protein n=1 Tax=Streptomyces albiflavescens TaxID=1623582 RepID=A0A918D153_9ACTN|nr:hypothetical protein GCM10011579_018820 [Streptomyces albiflavescens]